jgi:hypothetical protein
MNSQRSPTLFRTIFLHLRFIQGLLILTDGKYLKYFFPDIRQKLKTGGMNNQKKEPNGYDQNLIMIRYEAEGVRGEQKYQVFGSAQICEISGK